MFDLLGFGNMLVDSRKIANTKINGAVIDTCKVVDTSAGHETAIKHPSYNNGEWIIVQEYSTVEAAKKGHEKWVKLFENDLPKELKDVSSAQIVQLAKIFGSDEVNKTHKITKKRKKK